MIFKVEFSNQATKFIRRLSEDIKERIKRKFREVSEDPFRYLEHYEGDDCHKLRIGDFRSLIDVDFNRKILFVRVFDKRGRIYKR
jgi:mRNA-degrading endonuclease RelE of RelBE toxin-antitoxin system